MAAAHEIDYLTVLGWIDFGIEPGQEGYEQAVRDEIAKHSDCEGGEECYVCAAVACPDGEPLHFHHDGCPMCDGEQAHK
jgi:hypothetical protein